MLRNPERLHEMDATVNKVLMDLPIPVQLVRTPRRNRWLTLLAWLGLATLLTFTVWSVNPWLVSHTSHAAVSFEQFRFKTLGETSTDAGGDWQTVSLPDTWASRGQGTSGKGVYDITFSMPSHADLSAPMPWAIRFDRLSFVHRLFLNGQLIHTDFQSKEKTGRPMAYLVQIPTNLLKVGHNQLVVEVQHSSLGGLSAPLIGRLADVSSGHAAQVFLTETLPLGINVVAATFAAFLTLIWLKRRSEVAMGMLGLLCLVVSIRNCAYYVVHGPTFPPELSAFLYFTAQTLATVLLGAFAMAIANKPWPWFKRLLWAVVVVYPVAGAIGASQDAVAQVRAVLYPGLLALMLPTLLLLLRVPAQYGGWSALGMVLGIALSLVAGIHDYLRLQGMVSVMHTYWLPLASPITLASYGVVVINRFVQIMHDVEQHNAQLEAKVQDRTRDLAAANAAKGHFLSAASHDLRQPVAAIGLLAGLLKERLKDVALTGITTRLMEAVRAMENLLSGLLDLSRLDAGAITPHYQAIDLNDMLKRIATHAHETALHKGLRLRFRPTQAVAWSDPVLLEQMVRNLVGNAIRYTSSGGVLVGVRRRGEALSIEVWDTGAGIAASDQARIFDDFVQVGNTARNQSKGLGLGLSIVRRASQLLDHPIRLQSQPARGSCFAITTPAHARTAAPVSSTATIASAATLPTDHLACLSERHVVLVEDDTALRAALALRLKAWGARVSALDSLEALEELLDRVMSIDLLVTDHQLTDGNGLQAMALARQKHAALPVLLITGNTDQQHLQTLIASGAPVLHKPFQADALLATLVSLLVI
jgi:signal transduction histidine kinase/CheY-like chemotaxis protein